MFYPEKKPEIDRDKVIQWTCNGVAIALSLCTLSVNFGRNPQAQLALLAGALPLSLVGGYHGWKSDQRKPYIRMRKQAGIEAYADCLAHQIQDAPALPMAPESACPPITPLESVLTTGVGIALFGNSGSGKSSIVQWLIGESQPDHLVILDPHNDGKTWGQLPVIDDYDRMLSKIDQLLNQELKTRRQRRKQGLPNKPMMIVCDEWPSIRMYARKRKSDICDQFVLLMGCEARKMKMVTILCSHSGNVKAMGLSGQGDFLENWCLVRLGKFAKKYSKNMSDRAVANIIQSQAYPCLINDELSHHPTHGHYQQFQDGQSPVGIKPYIVPTNTEQLTSQNQSDNSHDALPTPKQWV